MLSSLFSSKKNNQNTLDNAQQVIEQSLQSYRSEVFPQGILAEALDYSVTSSKKGFEVNISLPFPCLSEIEDLQQSLTQALDCEISIKPTFDILPVRQHTISGVRNIIAIASGKGGVGKSTTAVNLAYALRKEGARVGILDADIYGPSIPTMLGIANEKPHSVDGKKLSPIPANGLCAMSIGFLVSPEDATVWRGPMASSAFSQLLNETAWPELDYLLVDLPPGTGDIQLTLSQKVPVAAAVIITTPQDIALIDAKKGLAMFDKVQVPVLGVIENMSYHICENCGHHSDLFGYGGGEQLAKSTQSTLLGQLPLTKTIREFADNGGSLFQQKNEQELSQIYCKMARKTAAELYNQLDLRSNNTATITTEN